MEPSKTSYLYRTQAPIFGVLKPLGLGTQDSWDKMA
jgi:hypothetical protein